MKLQKIISRLERLHPREISLTLGRIRRLNKELGNPQDKLNVISVCGTNGKGSTAGAILSILESANYTCDLYTSPHCVKINERFIFSGKEIQDDELIDLFQEVEKINNQKPLTLFEFYTAVFILKASRSNSAVSILENGLFSRGDACSVFNKNLASVITTIHEDHMDWLPKNKKNIDQIIFEKTSSLLNSKIIVSEQLNQKIMNKIEKSIKKNKSKKIFFKKDFNYSLNENNFFYYEDEYGGLKLPIPNLVGEFQLSNVATAISTLRNIDDLKISDDHIKRGITKIRSIARLQEIKLGRLKNIIKNNKLFVDGSHNPLGAKVLTDYLSTIHSNKHLIIGMMANKDHEKYISFFKNKINSITTVDIPNQPNAIKGEDLKNKINGFNNVKYKKSIIEALKSLKLQDKDVVLISGSLYLAGEALKLN